MSLVVLTSACGSPGVTTTTLGLACTWDRPAIAVEADPVGGSSMLAGYFRGFTAPVQSVVDLLMAHRSGRLAEQLPVSLIPVAGTAAAVLPGPRSHAQAYSALELWEPLSLAWKTLGSASTDVLVDAGRLGMESYPQSLLRLADLVVLVTRSDLPGLAGARQWAEQAGQVKAAHPETPDWSVLVIGPGNPYNVREIEAVLGLPVVASLALDSRAAQEFSHGTAGKHSNRLVRDLAGCGQKVRDLITRADQALAPEGGA